MSLSRRSIVAGAALAGIRSTAANSAVTVGLLGCGDRGNLVAGYLVRNTGARLVALCDLYKEKIERSKRRIPVEAPAVYTDLEKLLASDVDAVIIATPVFLHPEHFEAAVQAGKHIFIEKPAAPDVAGCKRIIRAAGRAAATRHIAFGYQARYGPGYRKAKALLDAGAIGPLHMAHGHFIKGDVTGAERPTPRPVTLEEKIRDWKRWRELSGDIIVETYCHCIDVLNWFLGGHPQKAYGTGGRAIRRDGDNMDHVDVTFTYAGGIPVPFTGSQITAPFYRSAEEQFFGTKGTLVTSRQYWIHYRNSREAPRETFPEDITRNAVDEFVARIRSADPENAAVRSAESTLTAIMGRMAIDRKREVTWEEVLREG